MLKASDRIPDSISMIKGPRVLHVGCTGGRLPVTVAQHSAWVHQALVSAGFSVVGGDIQRELLSQMQRDGYEVLFLDAQMIPQDGEKFDTIFAGELIEHLANPGLFLTGARKRLKDGGRLVITTPNVWSPVYFLHHLKRGHHAFNAEHTVWFDQQMLRQILERSGFEIKELRYVDDLLPKTANSRWATAYAMIWGRIRRFIPQRFKNDMIVWAEPMQS